MGRRVIASLSTCDMCGKREKELWSYSGGEYCSKCKGTMERCDNQPGTKGPVRDVPGCFTYNRGRRAR